VEWVGFELRPEMPLEGVPLASRFSPEKIKVIYENLQKMGAPLGIRFGKVSVTPNTHLAHQASEYARDGGHYDSFHDRVFRAFFTDARDIGKLDVLLDLAEADGLDPDDLRTNLVEGRYNSRLTRARAEGERMGVTAIPAFVLNDKLKIVGAQSLDFFRERIRALLQEGEDQR
jgi:predicted DsbA family dithiol-disulfide isomerase